MILDKIIEYKKKEVKRAKSAININELIRLSGDIPSPLSLYDALVINNGIPAVIAEVKKASPSKGILRKDFDPLKIAQSYARAGASAISVLTDEEFFMGSLNYLKMIKRNVNLPILRKDFIIDEYQVYEAKAAGADAILLIVSALDYVKLSDLYNLATELSLDTLVEVHDKKEAEEALKIGAKIIGVNNRNLQTFKVSLETTASLAGIIKQSDKSEIKLVSESGISSKEDLLWLAEIGADAALIGAALVRQPDTENALKDLIN